MVGSLQEEVVTLRLRVGEEVSQTNTAQRRVEEVQTPIQYLEETDWTTFFIIKKLLKKSMEAQSKAMQYDSKVEVAGVDSAARVTSLVRRYAISVEGYLSRSGR